MGVKASELAELYPLDKLRAETLEQLAREAHAEEVARGTILFEAGSTDEHTLFLRAGRARGVYPDGRKKDIDAATLQGRYAIGDLQPRLFTATITSPRATVIRVDRRYLEKIQTWDQLTRDENFRHHDASPDANRWVFRLLQSHALHRLPASNIERLFQLFEEVPVRAGEVVVREGQAADFYYVIKEGAASVNRNLETGSAVVAYLVRGDTFGEDALLANTVRNATVIMMKDGKLMRLSKKAFDELLKPQAVEWLTPGEASVMARQGAIVLDVRMREEHERRSIKDAVNTPLHTMREAVTGFDKSKKYIVYCNTGERSAAAAFILGKLGFEVYALQGGISGMIRQKKQ
jgi:CRP-like cAMP-binding protein